MQLKFQVTSINPKIDLQEKFKRLQTDLTIHRIFATLHILNSDHELVLETEGIIDTGATISILPSQIFSDLNVSAVEPHTMWGVINKEECQFIVDLCKVPVRLQDYYGKVTEIFTLTVGFPRIKKFPILLGMKDLLAKHSYSYNKEKNEFVIDFS